MHASTHKQKRTKKKKKMKKKFGEIPENAFGCAGLQILSEVV
jgi:hypothetical protein